jgi:hypothetical protein
VPLSNFVSRGFGFVLHSIAILYHQVPNLSITIRNFFIAVQVASITHLSLAGAGLGDAGVVTLATALSHAKPSLVTLDLSNNAMGVDGSRAVARCLPDLASLETLIVHG